MVSAYVGKNLRFKKDVFSIAYFDNSTCCDTLTGAKPFNAPSQPFVGFFLPLGADFIRCHRGYMVNAAYIKKMVRVLGEYRELTLDYCDVSIPVSRQKAGAVKKWMGIG